MNSLIVNDQIHLEKIKFTHAFQVFQAIDQNRAFLSPWLPFVEQTLTQENTETFIQSVLAESALGREDVFVVWYRDRFAGLISLRDTDRINLKTEIGYWLTESMQGKGIMTRAVKALTEFVFTSMGLNRVQIRCGLGNEKSEAIPKRLGFHFEGVERAGEKHRTCFIDLNVYSLLKSDWGS